MWLSHDSLYDVIVCAPYQPAGQSDKEIVDEYFIKDSSVRQAQVWQSVVATCTLYVSLIPILQRCLGMRLCRSVFMFSLQLVVDWLERNALSNLESFPAKVNYFADSVTWENTLLDIQSGINQGHLVTEVVSMCCVSNQLLFMWRRADAIRAALFPGHHSAFIHVRENFEMRQAQFEPHRDVLIVLLFSWACLACSLTTLDFIAENFSP